MGSKIPSSLVIQEFKAVHGDLYDYSKFVYTNSTTKSVIICREHGEFLQPATTHRNGVGCPKCALIKSYNRQKDLAAKFGAEFSGRASEIHSNFYDYSKVEYKTARVKVCIICPIHGEFWQIPDAHLRGFGCGKCGDAVVSIKNSNTKDNFVTTAIERHGTKYNYDKVEYVSAATQILITCPSHGDFVTTPNMHLSGVGCPKCKKEEGAERTRREGLSKMQRENETIHGGLYSYSKTVYSGYNIAVTVTCAVHGDFTITPEKHGKGYGCPGCGKGVQRHWGDLDYFVEKARTVHGNKYDYSKSVYVNNNTKLIIICPLHGEFLQSPNKHLDGCECRLCGNLKIANSPRLAPVRDKLMEKVLEKFGEEYDYSKVKETYRAAKHSVAIICRKHGEFEESLVQHLKDSGGCPKCRVERHFTIGKKCIKCGEVKSLDEYHYNNKSGDGRVNMCKDCVCEYQRAYARVEQYGSKLVPSDEPTDINGWLFVKCKKCGKLFQPTVSACRQRRNAVNKTAGDSNFYCSDECRNTCDIFSVIKYPTSLRPHRPGGEFRDCSRVVKRALLANQCDNGDTHCEMCGDITGLDLHHTIQVKEADSDTNNAAGMIVLCAGCHTSLHSRC